MTALGLGLTARAARQSWLLAENAVRDIFAQYAPGYNGVWYDPSDLSTLFQDAAGTVPVTAVEQPVGLMLDKSGRGNHATQSTAGYKPLLSARVNLMTATEFAAGVSDAPIRGGAITASSLAGYAGALAFGYDAINGAYAYKSQSHTNGVAYRFSVRVKMDDGGAPTFGPAYDPLTDFSFVIGGNVVQPSATLNPDGSYTASAVWVSNGSGTNCGIVKYGANSARTFKCSGYDFRIANETGIPAYQRVNTASDYDTIGFPKYLAFDGADDFLVTGNVDFSSSDKIAVAAGVTKLSDAGAGIVAELSASVSSNDGSFYFVAPRGAGLIDYQFSVKGTGAGFYNAAPTLAPDSRVLSCMAGIGASYMRVYSNGVLWPGGAVQLGTGNFGNYPLYIGRRGGTSLPFNGRLYGLAICGGLDDVSKLRQIEQYLSRKVGVNF